MNATTLQHCSEIEACNQRGGRMLSIVDLIEARTFTLDLAAYALAAIGRGASFMVGAGPGGAGKTTVMGALLNFVPRGVALASAESEAVIERGLARPRPRCCFICHEIGSGPYYAYLWGHALRRYFELPAAGHLLATNLHADTCEEAYRQVCVENGVAPEAFRRMNLLFFLTVARRGSEVTRRIASVWESDGTSDHRQILGPELSQPALDQSSWADASAQEAAATTIRALCKSGARTIEDVRIRLTEAA